MKALDEYYHRLEEPLKSTLLALRDLILSIDPEITPEWKYGGPFFYYRGKMFCFLWMHKKLKQPYISFAEGRHLNSPYLLTEDRARFKILLVDPEKDIPVKRIQLILKKAIGLYHNGTVKLPKKS